MMTYNGSEYHKSLIRELGRKNNERIHPCQFCNSLFNKTNIRKHETSCSKNPTNIKNCECCGKETINKFCSSSCAAKINNKLYPKRQPKAGQKKEITEPFRKVAFYQCPVCNKDFYLRGWTDHRKSCGAKECKTHLSIGIRTYQNGSRKPEYYQNPIHGIVLLESSWERKVAEKLDSKNIEWTRPKPIKWTDYNQKVHLYYPDFYLPSYGLYIDPKNPYCMEQDKDKMEIVGKDIKIIFGDINYILDFIDLI